MAIERNARNEPYAVIKTFTDVLIEPGGSLQLGKSERKLPFTSCFSTYCFASSPFDSKFVQEIEAAPIAEVTVKAADGHTVKIKFPAVIRRDCQMRRQSRAPCPVPMRHSIGSARRP